MKLEKFSRWLTIILMIICTIVIGYIIYLIINIHLFLEFLINMF